MSNQSGKRKKQQLFLPLLLIFVSMSAFSQDIEIQGYITNSKTNQPIEFVQISVEGTTSGTLSDKDGFYQLTVDAGKKHTLSFYYLGYEMQSKVIPAAQNRDIELNIQLKPTSYNLGEATVTGQKTRVTTLQSIDPKTIKVLPGSAGDGLASIVKTFAGVSSANELSSQYSVRGGNFDENLVYVNDIEIYRPFLIRSGQQEGLSFINSDMVSSILFSAGGFDAKYGDKMSSVLDIKYRKPNEFAGSAAMSLLGGSAHVEGSSENQKFTHISGIRYKTSQYLLNSLETKGEYKPSFTDFQTYMTFDLTPKFELAFLANYAQNNYRFVPTTRNTDFGTVQNALNFTIYFDGQEIDKFTTYLGALSGRYHPNDSLELKFIASSFRTIEEETFDIQGQYYLNELDKEMGSDSHGDSVLNLGIGTYLDHARNYLDATVLSLSHKGLWIGKKSNLQWGVKFKQEIIDDDITEWKMLDSAGYSIPYTDTAVTVNEYINSNNTLTTNRITAYFQNARRFGSDSNRFTLTAGLRANYWSYTKQLLVSPRATLAYEPSWKRKNGEPIDILFRFATGYYYQPPFYKELRRFDGSLNENVKAQQSIHFLAALDYNFHAWNRPFKFVTEIYYKRLDNIIPYEVDNVRIRYYADQTAKGYATGIDFKVNGHFVKGVESWASLSLMQTKEDIYDDDYGYIPRPSDQILSVGVFFQDYFPRNDSYKVHLTMLYGTGLPHGPPKRGRQNQTLRMPSYKRVDIGFSKVLKREDQYMSSFLGRFKSIWLTAEVFNLLGVNNTISYMWIKVVPNQLNLSSVANTLYAVPNRLTDRRINIRLIAKF